MIYNSKVDINTRKENLEIIKQSLLSEFKDNITSAIVYGSTLQEDFGEFSDYDIIIVMKNCEASNMQKLKDIRDNLMNKLGIIIDFNVHSINDIPSIRKNVFWHNNRGFVLQKEFTIYGKTIIGSNIFEGCLLNESDIKIECIHVLNSYVYQVRKFLINKQLNLSERDTIIKFCIYAVMYSLAYLGKFPNSKTKCLDIFPQFFKTKYNPKMFFELKKNNPANITMEDLLKAYEFLCEIDELIFNNYRGANQ